MVSRLKRDKIFINQQSAGRFLSSADPRLTMQWPVNVCRTDFQIEIRVQPVDLSAFTQFLQKFSNECQGLLSVGPIIEFNFDDVPLLKPIQLTLPILVQNKKKALTVKPTIVESTTPLTPTTADATNRLSQQEIIFQQQQSIFKSMLGEG